MTTADQVVTGFLVAVVTVPFAMMLHLVGLPYWAIFGITFVLGCAIGFVRGQQHGREDR